MKILVIGQGARENALIWKLSQEIDKNSLYCAPGNAGTIQLAQNIDIKESSHQQLLEFAQTNDIDMTIVGPEQPLVDGITDLFRQSGLNIIGPEKKAAKLEGSKIYSKAFMDKYGIPTAGYGVYSDANSAIESLKAYTYPLVIKADGLAAGKGVLIVENEKDAISGILSLMVDCKFGDAGKDIIIEEFLEGTEASLLCLVDGKTILPLESARDYKKALDGDEGLNTGGMGCFSPNPILQNEDIQREIKEKVLNPFQKGIESENMDYRGIIFIGLMLTKKGLQVLEFNVRLGDPETEVVLPRLKTPLSTVFKAINDRRLDQIKLDWHLESSLCVMLTSGGYPEAYEKNKTINISQLSEETILFHGGTKLSNGLVQTNGGRVMAVTTLGKTLEEARIKVYKELDQINFEGKQYRSDIGKI